MTERPPTRDEEIAEAVRYGMRPWTNCGQCGQRRLLLKCDFGVWLCVNCQPKPTEGSGVRVIRKTGGLT